MVEPMAEDVVQSFMVQPVMVQYVAQSQLEPVVDNHDNICIVN